MTRGYFIPRAYRSCRRWKESMLSFMFLVVVHSSQLYRNIHSANTLKWRIFCDKVRYLLLYTWLFSFMVPMVIIFRRGTLSALHSVASEVASPGNADIWAWLKFLCGVLTRKSDIASWYALSAARARRSYFDLDGAEYHKRLLACDV